MTGPEPPALPPGRSVSYPRIDPGNPGKNKGDLYLFLRRITMMVLPFFFRKPLRSPASKWHILIPPSKFSFTSRLLHYMIRSKKSAFRRAEISLREIGYNVWE